MFRRRAHGKSRAVRVASSQRGQHAPGHSEPRDILARRPWLQAIGQWLRAEYNAVEQPVPERLAVLLKQSRVAAAECPANPAALLRRSRLACLPQRHVLLARGSWARTGPLARRQSGKEMPFLALRRAICAACQQDRCSGVTGRGHGCQESELITLLGSAATVVSLTHPRCCAADRPTDTQCARAPGNRAVL